MYIESCVIVFARFEGEVGGGEDGDEGGEGGYKFT